MKHHILPPFFPTAIRLPFWGLPCVELVILTNLTWRAKSASLNPQKRMSPRSNWVLPLLLLFIIIKGFLYKNKMS